MENDKKKVVAKKPTAAKPATKKAEKKDEVIFEEEKPIQVTAEQHMATMKLLQDLQEEVASLKAERKVTVVSEADKEENPADDYLDTPATFFSYSSKFAVYGDKRYGKIVDTPNGKGIQFESHYRFNKKTGGRGTETVSISRAVIRSKKEAEWLRSHTQFGIKFFESIKTAVDADVFLAEKMVQVSNMVMNLGDMQVVQRAKQEGIEIIDPDISNVRQQLIKKIATNQIDREKSALQAKAKTLGLVEDKKVEARAEEGDTGANVY